MGQSVPAGRRPLQGGGRDSRADQGGQTDNADADDQSGRQAAGGEWLGGQAVGERLERGQQGERQRADRELGGHRRRGAALHHRQADRRVASRARGHQKEAKMQMLHDSVTTSRNRAPLRGQR